MLRWFFYDSSVPTDNGYEEDITSDPEETKEIDPRRGPVARRKAAAAAVGSADDSDLEEDVGPTFDKLDPAVTAAILTQAAFRGYRLRERLRSLPAREAERTIRALQRNATGFRRLALFLTFFGLYFALVFGGTDVAFQRSVQQALSGHLALVKYGPESNRRHTDVSSLPDLYQWMQAFYLRTYHGTQLEHKCTACAIKPPDEVCNACDIDLSLPLADHESSFLGGGARSSGSGSGDLVGRRALATDSTSTSSVLGLSEECRACAIGTFCAFDYLENCAASLHGSPLESNLSVNTALNFSALEEIVLEPPGGVRASDGFLLVENVSQCRNYSQDVGLTENLGGFNVGLPVPYNGMGYVGNRNRVIGGMLITFTRRARLSVEECESSRDYYDVCLADKQDKDPIVPGGFWQNFRPDADIVYDDVAEGYPVLIDVGGFNTGINMGYCTLLAMEELEVIPEDEVGSVSVQLVTYNANEKSAYGLISITFSFDDGGEVVVDENITAYILRGDVESKADSTRLILGVIFGCMFMGMARHDTKKWWRRRRSKVKRNRCHCCCGLSFFLLIFLNILMWMVWSLLIGTSISFDTDFRDTEDETPVLDSISQEVVNLYNVALFASAMDFVFLLTTMAGLYRWIFQMLTFHKRMSIVTDTLSRASTHLDHFLFVFFLVVLVFAHLTWLLVGSSTIEFSTLEGAWRSVIRISLGESENFYPQILEAQPTVGPVVVVLYQVLGVVLLLNVVIAVLLEAYRGVVGGMRDEDTILESLVAFIGMTLCSWKVRVKWAGKYVRWRLSKERKEPERRPSLKVALQGSTGVYGVDGRPVLMIRRPMRTAAAPLERQLSFNCPRYITVTEMQALIEAAPVPAFVADRLVRKIVHEWVFGTDEKLSGEVTSSSSSSGWYGNGSSGGYVPPGSMPMLRRLDSRSSVS